LAAITAQIIEAAFALVFCEYMAGMALFSVTHLKSLGSEMLDNSLASAALVAAMMGVGVIANVVLGLLYPGGGAYAGFQTWVSNSKTDLGAMRLEIFGFLWAVDQGTGIVSQGIALVVPGMVPFMPLGMYVSQLVGPWLGYWTGDWIMVSVLGVVGQAFDVGWLVFVAWGTLIYALPFRLGRDLGASMISVGLVFHVGLPVLPAFTAFVSSFLTPPPTTFCALVNAAGISTPCDSASLMAVELQYWVAIMTKGVITLWLAPATLKYLIAPVLFLGILAFSSAGLTRLLGGAQAKLIPMLQGGA
jgi:hypothetical protein